MRALTCSWHLRLPSVVLTGSCHGVQSCRSKQLVWRLATYHRGRPLKDLELSWTRDQSSRQSDAPKLAHLSRDFARFDVQWPEHSTVNPLRGAPAVSAHRDSRTSRRMSALMYIRSQNISFRPHTAQSHLLTEVQERHSSSSSMLNSTCAELR